jgi:hypothetical protein
MDEISIFKRLHDGKDDGRTQNIKNLQKSITIVFYQNFLMGIYLKYSARCLAKQAQRERSERHALAESQKTKKPFIATRNLKINSNSLFA